VPASEKAANAATGGDAPEYDREDVIAQGMAWLTDAGLTTGEDHGEINRVALRTAVLDALLMAAVAETDEERDARAISAQVLTQRVVPDAEYESGPLATEAFEWVERKVWGIASNTKRGSVIQNLLGEAKPDHVVTTCRLRREDGPIQCVYVTGNPDLLMRDFVTSREERLHKVGESYADDMALLSERVTSMRARMTRRVKQQVNGSAKQALERYQLLLGPANGDDNGDAAGA
jgi:hypothetical protein